MTPEIDDAFDRIRDVYGAGSLDRIEEMLHANKKSCHPLQSGARWLLPGITQKPWHDPYKHSEIAPLVHAFQANHAVIKNEVGQVWQRRREKFADYEHYLTRQENWQALYLYRDRGLAADARAVIPTAVRVLDDRAVATDLVCPLLESHLSTLLPGAEIKPHCDLWNFSINLHFAIDIPPNCGIRVAGETRQWDEGQCLLFDYSFEHEAWNHGTRPRTCLLVDLWHPETTLAEREALDTLITEIRSTMA
ncbi:aspartyl/asparaginyl beta-hydroxylase domain-containing protein [Amycolatopsis sp. DG1A-15b]|uniref:aspartyl/asparaginyl beta-hydroxylase domain-containing protein n=1 Tax=Amycolatopsis sp. DG1A-15b TaxID=3052846 RepID=UPI00255BA199|nr:aspartyl/asparaginyl beta-hydroxylase domain-containing protein [Amycolatopsis sp. DG1A-15b]WIX92557.1 aspartyl/asparaginyl beta-hydroxylase domain-containing protein [Amycolatopsis sp. DG1A-15b]